MSVEIKVPQLPESVSDATLVSWHRKAGDAVRRDENLVDLETDKVVLEVPSPNDGILKEIKVQDGSTVTSGQLLAVLDEGSFAAASDPASAKSATPPKPPPTAGETSAFSPAQFEPAPARDQAAAKAPRESARGPEATPVRMGPAVRKLVEEHDLDPTLIEGTGKDGRIIKADVLSYIASRRQTNVGIDYAAPALAADEPEVAAPARREQRVAMTRLRRRIAERLVQAQQTAAMLTTFNEVDMTEVIALRRQYRDRFVERHGIKLGFMSFFIRATIEALREYPTLNASVDGSDVVYHEYFDIGVAVSTERGLLVPVLRDAELMSFAEIEHAIADYGKRARDGEIGMDELTGGTFTITNGGVFGSLMSTPILNPPQSGILGMHRIQERPMVVDGEIRVRPMMYLALTYDHRIIDGREAVQFLVHLKERLQDPARLLLQV